MPENFWKKNGNQIMAERKIHPTAGVTAVGARMPLVAFNEFGYR